MSAKCSSQNCNRKAETSNEQNMCVLCFDWYQKCQAQTKVYHQQNAAHYQELSSIYANLSSGVNVDQKTVMRALIGSMMNLMDQSNQISSLQEANKVLSENVKVIEDELDAAKLKLFHLEYNVKELEEKGNTFSPSDSIVIRNLPITQQGDEVSGVKKALSQLQIDDLDLDHDLAKVERKGQANGKLGSVFVKFSNEEAKKKLMKKKNELKNHVDPEIKKLKIMNFKLQEHILFENALRNVLSVMPDGNLYELNGNMRLISKRN